MVTVAHRPGSGRLMLAVSVVLLATACDFHYRASADPARDEIVVRAIPSATAVYDHPTRLSPQDLVGILQAVRVQFTSHWLQRLITGPLDAAPLFDETALARLAPSLAEALAQAGARDRIVFYLAERRADNQRDITSGTVVVKGRSLTITVANHRNRVDVVPGLTAYDRQAPEVAVAPQQFSLIFRERAFVLAQEEDAIAWLLDAEPPALMVDYTRFLAYMSQAARAR